MSNPPKPGQGATKTALIRSAAVDSVIRNFRLPAADFHLAGARRLRRCNAPPVRDNRTAHTVRTLKRPEGRAPGAASICARFIAATDREILRDAGKVTAETALARAESEFEPYRVVQDRLFVSDFDAEVSKLAWGFAEQVTKGDV